MIRRMTETMMEIQTITNAVDVLDKNLLQWRHEYKHPISTTDDLLLKHRLSKIFKKDTNGGSHGTYRVSSLYFDTPDDKALRQKIDGVNCREKFRLRFYQKELSFIRLEKKMKKNGLCGKYSARISLEEVQALLAGEYAFLEGKAHPLFVELYSKIQGEMLRPKTVVVYDREAFVYAPGNVRLTIDRNIRTGLRSTDFLDTERELPRIPDTTSLLEVKYDRFLPDIVRMAVALPNRQASAFSKYAQARRLE